MLLLGGLLQCVSLTRSFSYNLAIPQIRRQHLNEMTKQSAAVKLVRDQVCKSVTIPVKSRGFAFKCKPGEYGEHDKFLGVTNPSIRSIAKQHGHLAFADLQNLLASEYNEERFLALVILAEQYKKGDLKARNDVYNFYLDNMKYVNNWNLVDGSAYLIVGPHLQEEKSREVLTKFAASSELWVKRIAIVSTLHFIRQKDLTWTFKLATQLLNDEHDLMHKAVGWMLREAGKRDVAQLLAFLDEHAAAMPRTMLRYSLEKLSVAQKKHYMAMRSKAA
jgi:3-methyladenine DNA glycosylase AlkD